MPIVRWYPSPGTPQVSDAQGREEQAYHPISISFLFLLESRVGPSDTFHARRGKCSHRPYSAPDAEAVEEPRFYRYRRGARYVWKASVSQSSPSFSCEEVEDVLMADAGESEDDTWIPQEVPSGVMPEFLEGCSRDGAYEGYRSRSSSVLSYVDVGQFNTTAFARPPEQGQDDTSSSISSRSNSTVPSRQPSSTTSFTGSFTCPSSPLESRPQSHGLDPEVIKTLDRLSPPYRNDIIEVLACRGVSDKDRVNLAMQTPPAWDDIRSVLMGRGMNLMEWMLLRKALLRQLGFHLNTRIDSTTSTRPTMKNDLFLVYLNSLTSPTGTPITVPPRFFLNLGFYLLSDIHLLASFKSQWLLAGTYLLSEGLTYLQWLSLKRSLRDIAHIDKYALPPPHRSLRDFLSSLSIPLNHKGYAFNEIGIDSGVDLDLLSRFPEQWDDVFKELGSIAEFSLTEGTILQDGLRARASCFNS